MILHKNDDAFRRFYRRQNQASRKSTHVTANHSTKSLWLKLTRLGTITIDEPQRGTSCSEQLTCRTDGTCGVGL